MAVNPQDRDATLEWALDLWKNMMGDDFGEIRRHWYPSHTPGLHGRRAVNDDAWDELESSFEQSVVLCVQGSVRSLTAPQRGALERHLELCMVVRVPHYEERLEEAKQKVWLALLSNGAV